MPVMGQVLDMLQKQANIAATTADTDFTKVKTALGVQEQQARDQQTQNNAAYQQELLRQQNAGGPPTENDPTTKSVKQSQDDEADPQQKIARDLSKQVAEYKAKADTAIKYRQDPKPFLEAMEKANTNLREVTKDALNTRADRDEKSANMLRDVDSPESLNAAMQAISANYGAQKAKQLEAQLPHDAQGNLLWNDSAKKVIAPLVNQFTTNAEKARQGEWKQNYDLNVRKEQSLEEHRKHEDRVADAHVAIARSNAAALRDYRGKLLERTGDKGQYKVTMDDQKRIDAVAKDYKIEDYRKGAEVADRTIAQLTDPKTGYESVTAAQARTLVDQGKLMMDNYRSRTGGKYQEQEVARMNGLLQRMGKFVDTIGEGDKILAKDQMLQLAGEMKTLYLDRNTDLVKDELKIAGTTNKKGGNADWLTTRGNIDDLVKANRAKKVKVGDDEYVAFGKNKEDIFLIPSAPPSRAISPAAASAGVE